MKAALRKLALPIAFLVVGLPLGIGVVMAMGDHEQSKDESAFTPVSQKPGARQAPRAQPRWERVAAFKGVGTTSKQFAVSSRAIQWKADWRCEAGTFRMTLGRPSKNGDVRAISECPDVGAETATGTGDGMLQVDATGPWSVSVRQQVDTALEEPKLPGMTADALLLRGRFHDVQKDGEGTVSLYRLPNGRLALRFEKFFTSPSPGLRLWLSEAPNVKSTLNAREARRVDAGGIRSTLGSYNQMLPESTDAAKVRTIVIWCPTVLIAFSAAPLMTP
jgi:hypothetical protein